MTEKELIALSPSQLTEVCVQFAAAMGWIDAPGGAEWSSKVRNSGGPEAFLASIARAIDAALGAAAVETHVDVGALRELEAKWSQIRG